MIFIITGFLGLVIALFAAEYLWKHKNLKGEDARKLIHIIGGLFAAVCPLFLSWTEIKILITTIALVVFLIRYKGWFKSFYDIKRHSWGDVIYPATIAIVAMANPPLVLYEAIVLNIALADGLAAIIGTKFGRYNSYQVFGYKKSVAGTTTFLIVSLAVMLGIFFIADLPPQVSLLHIVLISMITTAVENIGTFGIDNALIAITIATLMIGLNIA